MGITTRILTLNKTAMRRPFCKLVQIQIKQFELLNQQSLYIVQYSKFYLGIFFYSGRSQQNLIANNKIKTFNILKCCPQENEK